MPSEPMNIQEQGFRSSLFGFDKNDVLAYMNALANEAQQHELEYNRQLQQMQSRLDELRSQQSSDDSRIEALKAEVAAANQRAEAAETRRRESEEQLETLQKQTASYQSNQRESQKNANIWQLKHHDLQQKNDDLQKQVEELQKQLDSARQLNASSLSAPASDLVREAKLEAGKILADARLYAESAEKELKQQADSQITAFFRLGVVAQLRGGHQQEEKHRDEELRPLAQMKLAGHRPKNCHPRKRRIAEQQQGGEVPDPFAVAEHKQRDHTNAREQRQPFRSNAAEMQHSQHREREAQHHREPRRVLFPVYLCTHCKSLLSQYFMALLYRFRAVVSR